MKRTIPYVLDTETGRIAISHEHENNLRELARVIGQELSPVRTQTDLAIALVTAWVGETLKQIKEKPRMKRGEN